MCFFIIQEDKTMKPMIWHPEDKDEKVNKYLDRINHEPWLGFVAFSLAFFMAFILIMFMGIF
ncbi:ssr3129 [Synechocystis sp. PCC 6803]|uniref:Ssr3129 protein n=2 Tax=Synechocystis TaxID=1142 RepID=P73064_SYNY3|nr:hypothetical protein MYO_15160 [Synechocystis sp. PCC 6803]AVP88674.1 hypothetical protein C7I86_02640 [Synechocystis sp. IPPAS B-1465]MBD2618353.1 hypothetical protein [Synechocystis sp. FACHB-898]MBD2638474.1 hypothetical protein [Synechocystis sp. FACHB-908]MBD2662278.1 hypothetical protein [Synechocystis sp. FACHB-929]BAL28258.1 hypothetical protein SYNGTI_0511 [Synechocystis sp. PCC 6803 substr. GT-I]BAL31428.1 hypothetical protein SYNPCCN_0511 [Synechocystis sp. PCC 6803 substr. PCC-